MMAASNSAAKPCSTSSEAAHDHDILGAVVAAQLLDIHGDEELVLKDQDAQACKQVGTIAFHPPE